MDDQPAPMTDDQTDDQDGKNQEESGGDMPLTKEGEGKGDEEAAVPEEDEMAVEEPAEEPEKDVKEAE